MQLHTFNPAIDVLRRVCYEVHNTVCRDEREGVWSAKKGIGKLGERLYDTGREANNYSYQGKSAYTVRRKLHSEYK